MVLDGWVTDEGVGVSLVEPQEIMVNCRFPDRNLSPYIITNGHGHHGTSQS